MSAIDFQSVLFFDQAVWCEDGPHFTPGFLKRLHLTDGSSVFRSAPFEVHFLHNSRGRRVAPEKIGAFDCAANISKAQLEHLHYIAANGLQPLAPGKKPRALSAKEADEINAALVATGHWSLDRGVRVRSLLPHSIYASLTIEVLLDAALAGSRVIDRNNTQQVVRAQVLAVDPSLIRNPIITNPPLFVSPRTPVRIVSSSRGDAEPEWKFAGDFTLLGSAVHTIKYAELRAAVESTCVHRMHYESKADLAVSKMFATVPDSSTTGDKAKKKGAKSSVSAAPASSSAAWVSAWRCGQPFSSDCFTRRHWWSVRHAARTAAAAPKKPVKHTPSVPLDGIDSELFGQQLSAHSETNLKALLGQVWHGTSDPRDQQDSDMDIFSSDDESGNDAADVAAPRKRAKRAKTSAASEISDSEPVQSEQEIRSRFADIRAEAAEQREDWAKWSLRAQKQLRDRNAFQGPLTLFETLDRSTLAKMFSSQTITALSRHTTSTPESSSAAKPASPAASKAVKTEKSDRLGQWSLADFMRVTPSNPSASAAAPSSKFDFSKLPPHSLTLPHTLLLPFFAKHSSSPMISELIRTNNDASKFDFEAELQRHRAVEHRWLTEVAEKKSKRTGKVEASPVASLMNPAPPGQPFPQRIYWTSEGTLASQEQGDSASSSQRRASSRTQSLGRVKMG